MSLSQSFQLAVQRASNHDVPVAQVSASRHSNTVSLYSAKSGRSLSNSHSNVACSHSRSQLMTYTSSMCAAKKRRVRNRVPSTNSWNISISSGWVDMVSA